MSKLSFRARALDASKPMPIYLAEELPDLPDYSAINRAVPQMPSGMEKEEESEHHLQRAISGTGLIIPTPEVCEVTDLGFYERCYPPDYKMPKQHIHMQPLWEEQEAPEYDIDSEDERWLKQQRHAELTEWKFEQMMDKLEKSSGQTVVTLNEAKLLLERHDDLVTAVYDYWLNKRLNTQHPLILSVKTENRPGQSSHNPYLAFRRRTEKMQTRKNRKNDESSYEKMLKLRRDLARALTLLELVARRETAKRELVKLTASLAERRYAAGDFANQLLPDPPPRPAYPTVPLTTSSFRAYSAPHYPPRAPPTPQDLPRQREKRSYKKRKPRHPAVGTVPGLREGAMCSSSEEESTRPEVPPVDDGPFAFRRKPGCYYEMPTSTLCGDPLDPDRPSHDVLYDHELDERYRFNLTSLNYPYPHCIGFARRRVGRGGRVLLDRVRTPLDDLWPRLPFQFQGSTEYRRERDEEVELETKAHRTPKEMTRDYHSGGKHPWRHAFRQHLAKHPHLWTEPKSEPKPELELKIEFDPDVTEFKTNEYEASENKISDTDASENKISDTDASENKISDACDNRVSVRDSVTYKGVGGSDAARTIECNVKDSLDRARRKRSWSGCSDSSYDSDESLQPVEREFEKFITEVNKKWLHFRPKTPPPSPPSPTPVSDDVLPIALDTPLAVELRSHPSDNLQPFTTTEFTLTDLYGDINPEEKDHSGSNLDISGEDLLGENFTGLTEAQVESILSETDLKALADVDLTKDDKKLPDELLELVNDERDPFLLQGQGADGRAGSGSRKRKADAFGSTAVQVSPLAKETMYVEAQRSPPATPAPAPPPAKPAVEPPSRTETIEEVQLPRGVQLQRRCSSLGASSCRYVLDGYVTYRWLLNGFSPAEPAREKRDETIASSPPATPAPAPAPPPAKPALEPPSRTETIEEVQLPRGVQLQRTHFSCNIAPIASSPPATPAPAPAPPPAKPVVEPPSRTETIEEVQLPRGVQLQTVQTAHSPLKKHIITSAAHRRASDSAQESQPPQLLAVAVSESLKVRLQNHLLSSQAGVLVQNGPFPPVVAVPVQQARETTVAGVSVGASTSSPRRVSAPLVHLAPASLAHKPLQIHQPPHSTPLVVAQSHTIHHVAPNKLKVLHAHPLTQTQRTQLLAQNRSIAQLPAVVSLSPLGEAKTTNTVVTQSHTIHHVAPNKLKVLHAHPLTQTQRTQLLAQNRSIAQLPAVVSLSPLGEAKTTNTALLKAAPGSVAQFFEIKSGQLGKGPHLVNVVRQPQPAKCARADAPPAPTAKRQLVSLDGAALKGPQRVSLSLDGRPLLRAALPAVRAQPLRHQVSPHTNTLACIRRQLAKCARADAPPAPTAKRQLVSLDGAALKGPQRVSLSLDGRPLLRAALPAVRAQPLRHQVSPHTLAYTYTPMTACHAPTAKRQLVSLDGAALKGPQQVSLSLDGRPLLRAALPAVRAQPLRHQTAPLLRDTLCTSHYAPTAKRQLVSLDGAALKGPQRVSLSLDGRPLLRAALPAVRAQPLRHQGPQRVSLSLDGRPLLRAALPAVRAQPLRHQIQLKNRTTTLQVATPIARSSAEPSSSIAAIPTPSKTASIPSAVVASLLQQTKGVQLGKGGQKIAISGPGGQALAANVQAIAFTAAQLRARQARLQPPAKPKP
ncbi:uncharacterized protein LOC135084793 [Ostrinia nubilalis]|uniref:uncharacterized protein LOC135084793 n=1 Tax=Ostrinia nubilalis TaxID=29057 RepID=UPI0030822EC2